MRSREQLRRQEVCAKLRITAAVAASQADGRPGVLAIQQVAQLMRDDGGDFIVVQQVNEPAREKNAAVRKAEATWRFACQHLDRQRMSDARLDRANRPL